MAELLLELFSEEIPARMQQRAAEELCSALTTALGALKPTATPYWGARRIAAVMELAAELPASIRQERGPRATAPEAALAGFLRKHGADRDQLSMEGDYYLLNMASPTRPAADLIAEVVPGLLRRFPWPKSMRWGSSAFAWVRPLRRILCILDGAVVRFDLRDGEDDGHGLASDNQTEGHRFMAPEVFEVSSASGWRDGLLRRKVIVDPQARTLTIQRALNRLEPEAGYQVLQDPQLLNEVSGLVEWPVVLTGKIGPEFMDLPAEVMQVSMRVNQRYFAARDRQLKPAPYFFFVSNIEASDGGAAIIAGNERVLRARFGDARYFWDLDRSATLESRVAALGAITFHAKLGSQADRVRRLERLAAHIAPLVDADPEFAATAARLAKADLTTGMVGEFPELQGLMGGYYAANDGEAQVVANAIRDHYLPKGPGDPLPEEPVGVAVALADKLDTLAGFFGIGEVPTGSGDPYALRRAALGVIRILREKQLRLGLRGMIGFAGAGHAARPDTEILLAFLAERLRVQLRAEGARHDVLNAVFAAGAEDDIARLLARSDAVSGLLGTEAGENLLAAYRRAANILRIEEKKDGPLIGEPDPALLPETAEARLYQAVAAARPAIAAALAREDDDSAMARMAELRQPVDAFFENVKVNDSVPELRANRLRLLGAMRDTMNLAADFSKIEG